MHTIIHFKDDPKIQHFSREVLRSIRQLLLIAIEVTSLHTCYKSSYSI